MSRIVAKRIGYPTSPTDPFENRGLIRLNLDQAAHVLAVAGTTSLAHGSFSTRRGRLEEAREALSELKDDAFFLSNGFWGARGRISWTPLTAATFDCGVIGYDASVAFIFWGEEED